MSGGRHSRTFPARRDALPQVEAFLAEVCSAAGLDRAMCLRVTLLVEELFTNTVVHGQRRGNISPLRHRSPPSWVPAPGHNLPFSDAGHPRSQQHSAHERPSRGSSGQPR